MTRPTEDVSPLVPRLLLAGMSVTAVLALTLAPRSLVAPARGAFMALADRFAAPVVAGLSGWQWESSLNALLFVPLGAALALLLGRRLWLLAPLLGFVVSFGVEYAQLRIPGRVPDLQDVLWNTLGAAAGAVATSLLLRRGGGRRRAG
ncbi:MAG: VanZ family protein [Microbacterium sp.]|uniref:VanZ family protein n=1 Tax=Microbacterium sp. TaxID=51671 RepID=UPI003F80436F